MAIIYEKSAWLKKFPQILNFKLPLQRKCLWQKRLAKVTVDNHTIITLDGILDTKRHILTPSNKSDKCLLRWYKHHVDYEFFKLYE